MFARQVGGIAAAGHRLTTWPRLRRTSARVALLAAASPTLLLTPTGASGAPTFVALASQSGVKAIADDFDADGRQDVPLVGGAGWTTTPVAFSRAPDERSALAVAAQNRMVVVTESPSMV